MWQDDGGGSARARRGRGRPRRVVRARAHDKAPRGEEKKSVLTGNPDDFRTKYSRDALRFTCRASEIRRDKFRGYLLRPWKRRVADTDGDGETPEPLVLATTNATPNARARM